MGTYPDKQKIAAVDCPFCGHTQQQVLHPMIDLVASPAKKLGILTDSLFFATCTACGKQFEVVHELVVADDDAGYAILLAPQCSQTELPAPDGVMESHRLRLVTTNDELKEKVLLFDGGLDDRTVELCKLYLSMQLGTEGHTLLFTEHRASEGSLLFSVFDAEGHLQNSVSCQDSLYTSLYRKGTSFVLPPRKFCRVDATWAYAQIEAHSS